MNTEYSIQTFEILGNNNNKFIIKWYRPFMPESPPNIHRLCVKLMYTLTYVNMSNVTAYYRWFSDLIVRFKSFHICIITCLIRYNFVKLLQIM